MKILEPKNSLAEDKNSVLGITAYQTQIKIEFVNQKIVEKKLCRMRCKKKDGKYTTQGKHIEDIVIKLNMHVVGILEGKEKQYWAEIIFELMSHQQDTVGMQIHHEKKMLKSKDEEKNLKRKQGI